MCSLGINLPLMLDQRLIGVLGITGEPAQLRTYAELVRMTAEMLVGQRNQQAEQQWRRQRCDDLLALLLGDAGDSAAIVGRSPANGPRAAIVAGAVSVRTGPGTWARADRRDVERVVDVALPGQLVPDLVQIFLLWCRPVTASVENERLLGKLDGLGWNILRIAVGGQAEGLAGLRRCYRRVTDLLAYGRDVLPQSRLLALNRYRLPVLLWRHRSDDALDELLTPLRKVIAKDSNGQLLATLRSWCEHDGQSQACADALGIHRNSLRYRMERIAELSGVDLLRLDGMLALYLGVQLLPQTADTPT